MKKKYTIVCLIIMVLIMCILVSTEVHAEGEAYKMKLSCYLPTGNKTASGVYPYEGIVASFKERIGQTAILFECNDDGALGEFIGIYEVADTGGKSIRSGKVIDVYKENLDDAVKFIKNHTTHVYVYFYEAKG